MRMSAAKWESEKVKWIGRAENIGSHINGKEDRMRREE